MFLLLSTSNDYFCSDPYQKQDTVSIFRTTQLTWIDKTTKLNPATYYPDTGVIRHRRPDTYRSVELMGNTRKICIKQNGTSAVSAVRCVQYTRYTR